MKKHLVIKYMIHNNAILELIDDYDAWDLENLIRILQIKHDRVDEAEREAFMNNPTF